jgi:hypothetical protein
MQQCSLCACFSFIASDFLPMVQAFCLERALWIISNKLVLLSWSTPYYNPSQGSLGSCWPMVARLSRIEPILFNSKNIHE